MVEFKNIHPDLVRTLKDNNIQEKDIFHRYSDLHIGFDSIQLAQKIKYGGKWKSMSNLFRAQKGSDMENYSICLEIPFAYTKIN